MCPMSVYGAYVCGGGGVCVCGMFVRVCCVCPSLCIVACVCVRTRVRYVCACHCVMTVSDVCACVRVHVCVWRSGPRPTRRCLDGGHQSTASQNRLRGYAFS